MEFKDLVKSRRKALGLTMEDVAKGVGVSKATVQRWESGEIANVRRDKIASLANTLKTTPSYLMGWEDDIASLSDDELDSRIIEVFNRLSEEKQKQALDYMNFLASQD